MEIDIDGAHCDEDFVVYLLRFCLCCKSAAEQNDMRQYKILMVAHGRVVTSSSQISEVKQC